MKKFFTILTMLIVLASWISQQAYGQCTNTSSYGSAIAPTSGTVTFSTCSYLEEYSTLNSVVSGTTYSCAISIGGFITVRSGTYDGPVVAFGNSPLQWTATTGGTHYCHWNTNSSCGTATGCVTTTCTFISGGGPYDPCASIAAISGCGSGNTQTYNFSGSGAGWSVTACGFTTPGYEKIYQFTAPATGDYSVQVTSATGGYVDYFWKLASGGCNSSGWTCIDDISTTGTWGLMSWTAGTTYYILLDGEGAGPYNHQFYMNCPLLPGDNCSNAQDLASLTSPYSSTTQSYLDDYSITCAGGNTSPDRFFYISVPNGYILTIGQTLNGYDSENYMAYGGTCPGSTQIACFDDPDIQNVTWTNSTGTTQTVWWVQDGYFDALQYGTFTLAWTLTAPSAPPSCTTPITPIDAATNVATTATLNWNASLGATGYKLYFGAGSLPGTPITLGAVTTYDPTPDMEYSTTYYWKVVPFNTYGDATGCSTWSFTTEAFEMKVPYTGNNSYTTCSGNLYDHGGSVGSYSSNANGYTVLYPTSGNVVQVSGTLISEGGYDYLTIFNGVGTGGTQLYYNSGTQTVPTFTSTDGSGALTVRFTSDGSVQYAGFDLTIGCVPIPSCPPPTGLTVSNITQQGADLGWDIVPDSFFDVFFEVTGGPAPGPFTVPTASGISGNSYTWCRRQPCYNV